MTIEDKIFLRYKVDESKLIPFGFIIRNNNYIYLKNILNDNFEVCIEIKNGKVKGRIIDLEFMDEYTNYRQSNNNGEFVNIVRNCFEEILVSIRDNCFIKNNYEYEQSNRISNLIYKEFGIEPEFLFDSAPNAGIYRKKDSKKWFAALLNLDRKKLDNKQGYIEVINLKIDHNKILDLLKKDGYYKAYHMNKKYWITIILDDTVSDIDIFNLIKESFNNVK